MGARTAKKVEKAIEMAEALSESVPWRQRAITKLEDLFCRIEDVAEDGRRLLQVRNSPN